MEIETIGQAWTLGWTLSMRCIWGKRDGMKSIRACNYRRQLDMETLVCTRGPDFPLLGLDTRLRCPRCGSRRVAVMFSPPTNHDASSGAA